MPYIHFTEQQKLQANAVDLVEFLRFKGEPLIRSGPEFRMVSNHSVTVQGNEWYDHAAEKGGGPVSFLKEFYGMNYQEAVLTLLNEDVSQLCSPVTKPKEKVKKPFELPPANDTNRRVFAYLLKHRHLDRDVLTTFVKLGLIYEDQKYHNTVFVGWDKDGTPRHAHKRSTNSQGKSFRMTVEGSDFRYAFNWPGSSGDLMVFEAPIDMLSFLSRFHDSNWAKHSYVALCGTSSQPMLGMLERYPQINTVHFCLDNDQAGQLATKRLAKLVQEKGLAVDALIPVLKDWNEDPMRTRLRLFLDWGITFGDPYQTPEHGQRKVYYAGRQELEEAIKQRFWIGPVQTEDSHPAQQGPSEKRSRGLSQESKPMATRVKKPNSGEVETNSGR